MIFLGRRFYDDLWCIRARLAAGKAESGAAGRCEGNVVRAISRDERGNINGGPHSTAETSGGGGHAIHGGRIGMVDCEFISRCGGRSLHWHKDQACQNCDCSKQAMKRLP